MTCAIEQVAPGIWRLTFGTPEPLTPMTVRQTSPKAPASPLPQVDGPPIDPAAIVVERTRRGLTIVLPATKGEDFYGGGLQLKSFCQTGLRKRLCVNSDPVSDSGDSHAPVPFYLSTNGYGVYVDTARTASFYFAAQPLRGESAKKVKQSSVNTDVTTLYETKVEAPPRVEIDLPTAEGVSIYLFAGPTIGDALRRYNLFSGGGAMPPLWGLGVWYRAYGKFNQDEAVTLAKRLRERKIPCDVYGLEPGWQSNAYACSFTWDPTRFPQPKQMIDELAAMNFRVNLWEHAFVHPTAPFYEQILPHCGSHETFGGITPDFSTEPAKAIFAGHHDKTLVSIGIAGFKLDECDGSDFIKWPWSFPDHAAFPGGMDGEQYHAVFGTLYAHTDWSVFRKHGRRTYGSVRNLGAFAAPLPYVLYSDLYDHKDFIRGILTAGVSGILWTPEVRHAVSKEDLIRRLQSAVLSPQAQINAWYIPLPPWEQIERDKNQAGERLPDWEAYESMVRDVLRLRMRLLPYLYTAFANYHLHGQPPFRPLVLDWPEDVALRKVDDQYMIGDKLMAAPMVAGQAERKVVLPAGEWMDFTTGQRYVGGQTLIYAAPLERVPLFVKADTVLLLAEPVEHVGDELTLIPHAFGHPSTPATQYEDDGETFAFETGAYCLYDFYLEGMRTGYVAQCEPRWKIGGKVRVGV